MSKDTAAKYALNEADAKRLRAVYVGGCAAFGCSIPLLTVSSIFLRPYLQPEFRIIIDLACVGVGMMVYHRFSSGVARMRMTLGRAAYEAKNYPETIAALAPFRSIFGKPMDPQGEAHYRLARACEELEENAEALKNYKYVAKFGRGQWMEKAKKRLKKMERRTV